MEASTHTTTHTEHDVHGHIHPPPQGFIRKYVFSLDHKVIGIQYFVFGLLMMIIAGCVRRTDARAAHEPQGDVHELQRLQHDVHDARDGDGLARH